MQYVHHNQGLLCLSEGNMDDLEGLALTFFKCEMTLLSLTWTGGLAWIRKDWLCLTWFGLVWLGLAKLDFIEEVSLIQRVLLVTCLGHVR